jgi:hypothetical protein
MAASAAAAVTISSFSLTPSTAQAGGHPDVALNLALAASNGDTPKDAIISLAPGLLANPGAVTPCSASQFQTYKCPGSSQIGDGSISATVLGQTVALPTAEYLVTPQGSSIVTIGLTVSLFNSPVVSMTVPAAVRQSPSVGIDLSIAAIPNKLQGVSVQVNALQIRLFGTVNGQPFIRNPTSCATATTSVTLDTYNAPSTPVSAGSSFTPTGCSSLPYAPQLTSTASPDQGDDGVAFAATITQAPTESATQDVSVRLPPTLVPRASAIAAACTSTDLSTCPPVGSATITSPLLGSPVHANLVLVAHAGTLPTLDAMFPPPLAITLQGTPSIAAAGFGVTFGGLPDVPITSVQLAFSPGLNSLLVAGANLCSQPSTLSGDFVAQSGATAHDGPMLTVLGSCSVAGGVHGGTGGGGTGGGGTHRVAVKPPTARVSFTGLAGNSPRLTLRILAGQNSPDLKSVAIRLPAALAVNRSRLTRGLLVVVDGRSRLRRATLVKGWLTIVFGSHGRLAVITLRHPTLDVRQRVVARRGQHRARQLRLTVAITDVSGDKTVVRPAAAAR